MYLCDLEVAGGRDEDWIFRGEPKHPRVFPCALLSWLPPPYTIRERAMMAFVAWVVDQDGWRDMVFNDEIVSKWKRKLEKRARLAGWVPPTTGKLRRDDTDSDEDTDSDGDSDSDKDTDTRDGGSDSQVNDPQSTGYDDDDDAGGGGGCGDDGCHGGDEGHVNQVKDPQATGDNDDEAEDDEDDKGDDNQATVDNDDDDEHEVKDDDEDSCFDFDANYLDENPLSCGFSDEMYTYCIEELRDKAKLYNKIGFVEVLEHHAAIFVSDDAVDEQLREELIAAVKPLEDVPDADKDWHPGSDGKVLDLVHPSLWPLVFGKTRTAEHNITLDKCLDSIGSGEVIPVPEGYGATSTRRPLRSTKFQWLPAEVDITDDGTATFKSYINNLHPSNEDLYHVLERLVSKFLPLWSATYNRVIRSVAEQEPARSRIYFMGDAEERCRLNRVKDGEWCGCPGRHSRPPSGWRPAEWLEDGLDEEGWNDWDLLPAWREYYDEQHIIVQPEPFDFEPFDEEEVAANYQTQGPWFGDTHHKPTSRLQIIVKLANIHLTPEKPRYDGGSWHVEGALNENICATGLYYYDNENITESYLSFRGGTDGDSMREFPHEQDDHRQFEAIYGTSGRGSSVLDVGSIRTKQGRLLAFPNVLQHRVEPFELVDKTKPGHRKIVALFLVDPGDEPVLSTADVPPQQKHWAGDDSTIGKIGKRLPQELQNMVYEHLECPYGFEEACKLREELMEERKEIDDESDRWLSTQSKFSLCEH